MSSLMEKLKNIYLYIVEKLKFIKQKIKEVLNMLKKEFLKFYKNSKFEKYLRKKILYFLVLLIKTKNYQIFLKTLILLSPYFKLSFMNFFLNNSLLIFIIIAFVIILLLSFI